MPHSQIYLRPLTESIYFAFAVCGILTEVVVYLIGVGYQPGPAAIVLGLMLGFKAAGKIP